MLALVLSGLEKALNGYLQLDPETIKRLSDMGNKIIKIEITDWNLDFFILLSQTKIRLLNTCRNEPDITIVSTFLSLFKVGFTKSKGSTLFKNTVEIMGNTNFGEEVRDILSNIDIDWEEYLSKVTGDIIAHKISVWAHRARDIGKSITDTLRENIKDYLQIEARFTPTFEEVDYFMQSITYLQYDVERTEARINHLLGKRDISA
ncbi:MAG: SCP2 domain-containing protein [Coxiella-like endosymbiont]|uniref:ubiquinone biosynthesis accessory factor UbiJ n=1 Tax=Coxiella-like endosymbiont TaxID=1592897 RepID=UPI00215A16A5|nr:SCP2 sterol-binding domain-containing protein [Coxiella-like endosymbiont]UVE59369.1 SCP2 sterol-binding domain-containing protein [Coxiella-like endosymbiont]